LAITSIILDLIGLTVLLHLTGGAENPLLFYFIFHALISGILLPPRISVLQTLLACVLFLAMIWAEFFGWIPHHPVAGFLGQSLFDNFLYLVCLSFVFTSLMFISLYIVNRITRRILERDSYLETANSQLKEKDRIKSEYVLRVSHDIKGHLAAIQSCIHPVQEGFLGPLNEGQKNLLDRAEKRTSRLLGFVKALLNLTIARLKEGSVDETLELSSAIRDAADIVESGAKAFQVGFEREIVDGPVMVPGSKAEIQATFQELLSNAVKYTRPGGAVRVTLRVDAGFARVTVSDNGIGIPPDELPHIFDEFYRSSNAPADESGTGVGLAMVKHVIEKLGGAIRVESNAGRGSVFHVDIPLLKA
jgi:signal transduction histidine kinase